MFQFFGGRFAARIDTGEANKPRGHRANFYDLLVGVDLGLAAGSSVDREDHRTIDVRDIHLEQHYFKRLEIISYEERLASNPLELRVPDDHLPDQYRVSVKVDAPLHATSFADCNSSHACCSLA